MALAKIMGGKSTHWDALARKHKLCRADYEKLIVWSYLNVAFSFEYDRMSDVTKLRKFGFHDVVNTEEMFLSFFDFYR